MIVLIHSHKSSERVIAGIADIKLNNVRLVVIGIVVIGALSDSLLATSSVPSEYLIGSLLMVVLESIVHNYLKWIWVAGGLWLRRFFFFFLWLRVRLLYWIKIFIVK